MTGQARFHARGTQRSTQSQSNVMKVATDSQAIFIRPSSIHNVSVYSIQLSQREKTGQARFHRRGQPRINRTDNKCSSQLY